LLFIISYETKKFTLRTKVDILTVKAGETHSKHLTLKSISGNQRLDGSRCFPPRPVPPLSSSSFYPTLWLSGEHSPSSRAGSWTGHLDERFQCFSSVPAEGIVWPCLRKDNDRSALHLLKNRVHNETTQSQCSWKREFK
jgi:hypothetical protein